MNYLKNNPNIINESTFSFKCVCQCPFEHNDSINSIDIYNNQIIYGTLMGDVYLCRIEDEVNHFSNKTIQNFNNIYKVYKSSNNIFNNIDKFEKILISEENVEKYTNIKGNNEVNIYDDINIVNSNFNDNNIKQKEYKKSEEFNSRNFLKSNYLSKLKINHLNFSKENNSRNYSIAKLKNKSSLTERKTKINQEYDNKNISFPKILKILKKERENISCLSFVDSNIVNISIGDAEIVHLENINQIYNNESSYIYNRISNYETQNKHILYCDNCICFLSSYYYLMIFTQFAEYNSKITIKNIKYENKNLVDFSIIKGKIEASNFCIPFDFDGDKFLYIDFFIDKSKSINIYYTLTKKKNFKYKISNDFGHINHMKLLPDNYIFLCRKTVICEIYKYVINDDNENCDFFIISSWVNNKEIISSNVYIFGSKTDIELEDKNISRDNIQYDKNEIIYIDDSINSKNKILDLNQKNENIKKHDKITPKKVTSNDLCKIDCLLVNRNNSDKNNEYCIITLDSDGIFHLYCNNFNIALFNLYKIINFDDKEKELFATGFPYYITMNELYFVISTDRGVFVISKN